MNSEKLMNGKFGKWKPTLLLMAVFAIVLISSLGAGCLGIGDVPYTCSIPVNVIISNNQWDTHEFTHLVELLQVEDKTCSCPSGYSLNDGVCTKTTYGECTDCQKVWIDTSHWGAWGTCQNCPHVDPVYGSWGTWQSGGSCNGESSNTCEVGTGSHHNQHHHRTYTPGYYNCHTGNDAYTQSGCSANHEQHRDWVTDGHWQYNCHGDGYISCGQNKEKTVTTTTTVPTCTCPQGYSQVGDTCGKVVDHRTVYDAQGQPANVHFKLIDDGFWFFHNWRWHVLWHDHDGDHDYCFNGYDESKTYMIRVTDVNLDSNYGQTQQHIFGTDQCGTGTTFYYTGPSCPEGQTRCSPGTCCNLASDNNNCGACGNSCPTGTTCQSGECVSNGGNEGGTGEPGTGGPGAGNEGAGPGGNVVQFTSAFTPYCDHQATNQAPALVTFVDRSTYSHRTSAVFDFGDGYNSVDACLSDVFNGVGTPENVSVCELRQKVYNEPDPAPVNYLDYIHVQHLYANPGTYSVTLTDMWDLGNMISPPYTQTTTLVVKSGRGECSVLGPGDTYHKPFQISIS